MEGLRTKALVAALALVTAPFAPAVAMLVVIWPGKDGELFEELSRDG